MRPLTGGDGWRRRRRHPELRRAGWANLVLDLRGLTFLDSSGVRLLDLDVRRNSAGPEPVQRLLRLSGVASRLTFVKGVTGLTHNAQDGGPRHRVQRVLVLADTQHLRVEESRVGMCCVLDVEGEIDLTTAPMLRAAFVRAVEDARQELWVDLTRIGFMDSTGVHALLGVSAMMEDLGRGVAVICPPGPTLRLLAVTGALERLHVHPDPASAHIGA